MSFLKTQTDVIHCVQQRADEHGILWCRHNLIARIVRSAMSAQCLNLLKEQKNPLRTNFTVRPRLQNSLNIHLSSKRKKSRCMHCKRLYTAWKIRIKLDSGSGVEEKVRVHACMCTCACVRLSRQLSGDRRSDREGCMEMWRAYSLMHWHRKSKGKQNIRAGITAPASRLGCLKNMAKEKNQIVGHYGEGKTCRHDG
eukprot:753936-Hanusia_phi.AAC.4